MTTRTDIRPGILAGKARSLLGGFLELAWPTRCIGCDLPGTLLCDKCRDSLPLIAGETACTRCGAPYGSVICTECWTGEGPVEHSFARAACAMEFRDTAAKLITGFKDSGELRLANIIAQLIAEALAASSLGDVDTLTYIPATREALLRRGYDHMELVARQLSARIGLEPCGLLEKGISADQRRLGRLQRSENVRDAFTLRENAAPRRLGRVLLVDDVFTTGATLDAASEALLAGGAEEVVVAAACRVW